MDHYRREGRDLPWRRTLDPYAVLVSEVMLQQTQVSRVLPKYAEFLHAFPDVGALASAPLEAVLRHWQGLGYNRRAVNLRRAAQIVAIERGGEFPRDVADLRRLPGVGPATAAAVAAFAFGLPALYVETNVRAVFLHHFFADREGVTDAELMPLVDATLDRDDPRTWYYALMDYGVHLKRTIPNPSRGSAHHVRQSRFEGSHRQARSRVLRAVLAAGSQTAEDVAETLGIPAGDAVAILEELESDGFLVRRGEGFDVG